MGRHNRRLRAPDRAASGDRTGQEDGPDGAWSVRPVTGAAATKAYRCPGCDQEVRPGTPHMVAWPSDGFGGLGGPDDRRHWHTPCWAARGRRAPRVQRGRDAPRF